MSTHSRRHSHTKLDCYDRPHVFDTRDSTDNYYNKEKDNHFCCENQPCPNRISGKPSAHVDTWGVPILSDQADRIRRAHPKGHFEEKSSEDEVEGELFTSLPSPSAPIAGPSEINLLSHIRNPLLRYLIPPISQLQCPIQLPPLPLLVPPSPTSTKPSMPFRNWLPTAATTSYGLSVSSSLP